MAEAVHDGIEIAEDGVARCYWANSTADYRAYHDDEWGFPVADDMRLFEKLSLEGFQAGLSWLTILRKREAFRAAFDGFDFARIASFTSSDVQRLLQDAAIVRHRGKIEAVINNAQRAVELVEAEGSLGGYLWGFAPEPRPRALTHAELSQFTTSGESRALAKDLKRRGWRFVGPTTVYAFMQSMGLVNDHMAGCAAYEPAAQRRAAFAIP